MQLLYIFSIVPVISILTGVNSVSNNFLFEFILTIGKYFHSDEKIIYFVFFVFLAVVANLSVIICNYFNYSFNANLLHQTRKKLFHHFSNKDFLSLSSKNLSYYNSILFQQTDRFANNLIGSINQLSQNLFNILIISISVIYILANKTFILFGILVILFLFLALYLRKFFSDKGTEITLLLNNRLDLLNKLINNIKEIKIYNLKNKLLSDFVEFEKRFNNNNKKTNFINHSTKPFLEIFIVIMFSIVLFLNKNLLLNPEFFLQISLIIFAFYKLMPSINNLYSSFNQIIYDKDSLITIFRELDPANNNNTDIIVNQNTIKDENLNKIEIRNLNFSYDKKNLILNNLNIEFKKNEIYLISGVSGSGKTTLLNIILGLIKVSNKNFFVNGKEYQNFQNISWYKIVSFLPQKISLFNDTLIKNVTLNFDGNYNLEKYKKALKSVSLDHQFKDRQNEKILENQSNISGGQAQRIGLARALYKDSKLIILDEPTSNLDNENEKKFLEILENIKKDKIILMISHKNHEDFKFSKIFTLQNGVISER